MRRWWHPLLRLRRMNVLFFLSTLALVVTGVLFIYSAQYVSAEQIASGGQTWKYERQIYWLLGGFVVYFTATLLDYRILRRWSVWVYLGSLLLLVLVLAVGDAEHGAQRWLKIAPGVNLQPSEVMKLALVVALARFLSHPATDLQDPRTMLAVLCMVGLPFFLIAAQPDLGTAMVLAPFTLAMLFCAGVPVRYIGVLCILGVCVLPLGWFVLDDYQKDRILVFLDSDRDPLGAGWNKIQSEIAVGSGGLRGKGFLHGTQNILGFLPRSVAPTDFIYSVIAEEMGFIGSAAVLFLFAILVTCGMRTALLTRDKMGRLLAVGVTAIMFGHIFVNVAMTIGLMPITGLPLPLLSYGGSFTMVTLGGLGLIQSVYVRRPRHD